MTEWEVSAVAFWLPDAKRAAQKIRHRRGIADCRLPIADCRLPIADCRLPIADCRLPIADCRLPILRQRRLRSSWSGWFVSCLFLLYYANDFCHRQKPLYPQKPKYQVFFVIFLFPSFPLPSCHSHPGGNDDLNALYVFGAPEAVGFYH